MNVTEVVSGLVADHAPGAGLNRFASVVGRLVGLGLVGGAHLVWRAGAATLGLAGAAALVSAVPQLLSDPDFAVSPVQAATPQPARAGSEFNLQWRAVTKPIAVFGLESPEVDRMPLA